MIENIVKYGVWGLGFGVWGLGHSFSGASENKPVCAQRRIARDANRRLNPQVIPATGRDVAIQGGT